MENIFEIVTIKSLSDNYIWLLRNNVKNLTAVIDPSDDKDVNEDDQLGHAFLTSDKFQSSDSAQFVHTFLLLREN